MRITQVVKIEDVDGQFGPQKKITVNDELGKMVSGWVPVQKFNAAEWVIGGTPDVDVTQNGKYWNFKLKSKKAPTGDNDRVLNGLVELFKMVKKLQSDLDEIKAKIIPEQLPGQDSYEETPF